MEENNESNADKNSSFSKITGNQLNEHSSTNLAIPKKRIASELWLHASIMCGREFLYAVEIVLVTPIILQLGMPEKYYSFMWCFSPICGLLIGPVLGARSDRSTSRFGRRRPYIVAFVIGAILGLTLLIFSKDIASLFGGDNAESRRVWGVVVGVFGAQMMDFCLDQAEMPLRAYTLDVCSTHDQHRAFALQTVFIAMGNEFARVSFDIQMFAEDLIKYLEIGIGGALGFIIDGIDWESVFVSEISGFQIKVVYVFAVITYLSTTICNLVSIKEVQWKPRVALSKVATASASFIASKLPSSEKSKSLQETSLDFHQLANGNHNNNNDETLDLDSPSHSKSNKEIFNEAQKTQSRAICFLPHLTLSSSIYLSNSCPGGLNNNYDENDESLSSLATTNDSAYYEESGSSNQINGVKPEDIHYSLPSLAEATRPKPSLLNFIRSRQFAKHSKSLHAADSNRNSWCVADTRLGKDGPNENLMHNNPSIVITNDSCENVDSDSMLSDNGLLSNNGVLSDNTGSSNCIRKLNFEDSDGKLLPDEISSKRKRENKAVEINQDNPVSLKKLWLSILTMPSQLRWLCLAQLLGFVGMETILLWYTDLIGRIVYSGLPQAAPNSTELMNYNAGVKMGCWGLAVYSVAMVVCSAVIEHFSLLKKFSIRYTYAGSFMLMVVSMVFMYFFTNLTVIMVFSGCMGVMFAIILIVPFILVGKYHHDIEYVRKSPGKSKRGFGLDCAILACQMYAGNIISAAISSPLIGIFGSVKVMLIITCVCHLFGFFCAYFFVSYPNDCRSNASIGNSTSAEI